MINLITGTPGSGKTSYALQFMRDQIKGSSRKLYVHGIPHLKIPHEKLYCRSLTCDVCNSIDLSDKHESEFVDGWHKHVSDGSVIFIDECQNVYRNKTISKDDESLQSLEVHRHRGLDFFFITQSPKLIDMNVKALVSRHIHLKPTWMKRVQYEWPECKDSVQSTSDAISSTYKLDKSTFDLYQSATVHTKQSRKKPFAFYLLGACIVTLMFMLYYAKQRISNFNNKLDVVKEVQKPKLFKKAVYESSSDVRGVQATRTELELVKPVIKESCFEHSKTSDKCYIKPQKYRTKRNSYCIDQRCYYLKALPQPEDYKEGLDSDIVQS